MIWNKSLDLQSFVKPQGAGVLALLIPHPIMTTLDKIDLGDTFVLFDQSLSVMHEDKLVIFSMDEEGRDFHRLDFLDRIQLAETKSSLGLDGLADKEQTHRSDEAWECYFDITTDIKQGDVDIEHHARFYVNKYSGCSNSTIFSVRNDPRPDIGINIELHPEATQGKNNYFTQIQQYKCRRLS